jgi:hypothetical protein
MCEGRSRQSLTHNTPSRAASEHPPMVADDAGFGEDTEMATTGHGTQLTLSDPPRIVQRANAAPKGPASDT